MKILDYVMLSLFVIALVATAFFWGCQLDAVVTVVAALVALVSFAAIFIQNRKMKQLGLK